MPQTLLQAPKGKKTARKTPSEPSDDDSEESEPSKDDSEEEEFKPTGAAAAAVSEDEESDAESDEGGLRTSTDILVILYLAKSNELA